VKAGLNWMRWTRFSVATGILLAGLLAVSDAGQAGQSAPAALEESLTEKANDPTASLTQFQIKDGYTPSEYGTNAQPNSLLLRGILAVSPKGPLNLEQLIRPTLEIDTNARGRGAATRTAFGDIQLLDLFVMPWPNSRDTRFRWGIGPYFIFPTASWHGAGAGAWQLGPAAAFGYRGIPHLVISGLFQQATSFAYTSPDRSAVSSLTFQPMITYEFRKEWYLASNQATWKMNFHHRTSTTIPISAGIGKIWSIADDFALNTSLSGEWMLYRQFAPQEEQFSLWFQMTLLFPNLKG
jgi:hypothetical protein